MRILLVEDHPDTLRAVARLLRARRFEVTTAETMGAALAAADQSTFDLLISDIGLPDGDGNQLMQALHSKYRMKGIAVSGFGAAENVDRSRASGFSRHLVKPLNVAALEAAIREVHGGHAASNDLTSPRGS